MDDSKIGCPTILLGFCTFLGIVLAFIGAHFALRAFIVVGAIANITPYLVYGLLETKAKKFCRAFLDFVLCAIFIATIVWLFRIDISLYIIAGVAAFAAAPSALLRFYFQPSNTD